jgi:hypothetical protein
MAIFTKNVDEIIGTFTKTIGQLQERAVVCQKKAEEAEAFAQIALASRDEALSEAARANTIAERLLSVVN